MLAVDPAEVRDSQEQVGVLEDERCEREREPQQRARVATPADDERSPGKRQTQQDCEVLCIDNWVTER